MSEGNAIFFPSSLCVVWNYKELQGDLRRLQANSALLQAAFAQLQANFGRLKKIR